MTSCDGIRVDEVAACYLCGKDGDVLYRDLRDRVFGASGVWNLLRCPQCGLVWLNPRPVPEDLGKVYMTYYTHADWENHTSPSLRDKVRRGALGSLLGSPSLAGGWGWQKLGAALILIPLLKEAIKLRTMCLDGIESGKLLDVGCGNGTFLALMRDAGWDVFGVDSDPAAVEHARQLGIPVTLGSLSEAGIPDESFDAVTLHHVIEHVFDPIRLLLDCRRILKRKGRLVVLTPNIDSEGHQTFGEFWRGLEPPRHIHLFSLSTLKVCFEKSGLRIVEMRSTARSARLVWAISHVMKTKSTFSESDLTSRLELRGLTFQLREQLALRKSGRLGEELVVVATH